MAHRKKSAAGLVVKVFSQFGGREHYIAGGAAGGAAAGVRHAWVRRGRRRAVCIGCASLGGSLGGLSRTDNLFEKTRREPTWQNDLNVKKFRKVSIIGFQGNIIV